jgi:hypothetical protein
MYFNSYPGSLFSFRNSDCCLDGISIYIAVDSSIDRNAHNKHSTSPGFFVRHHGDEIHEPVKY